MIMECSCHQMFYACFLAFLWVGLGGSLPTPHAKCRKHYKMVKLGHNVEKWMDLKWEWQV